MRRFGLAILALVALASTAHAETATALLLDIEPYICDGTGHTGGLQTPGLVTLDQVMLSVQVPAGQTAIAGVNLWRGPDGSYIGYFSPDTHQQEKQPTRITVDQSKGQYLAFSWWCLAPIGLPTNVILWVEYHTGL